jgi:integrase
LRTDVDAGSKALNLADLRKIINAQNLPPVLEKARDYFLISFYLLGMNNVDMYYCTKCQYIDGRINYSRRKTQRRAGGSFISIPVSKYAAELIDKYAGEGDMLFNFSKRFADARRHNQYLYHYLPRLHALLNLSIDLERFSWYSARHTWASIAANECHFSDAEVARALNHQSEHKITRGYIRPDWSLLDRMNEAVLAVVFQSSVTD